MCSVFPTLNLGRHQGVLTAAKVYLATHFIILYFYHFIRLREWRCPWSMNYGDNLPLIDQSRNFWFLYNMNGLFRYDRYFCKSFLGNVQPSQASSKERPLKKRAFIEVGALVFGKDNNRYSLKNLERLVSALTNSAILFYFIVLFPRGEMEWRVGGGCICEIYYVKIEIFCKSNACV